MAPYQAPGSIQAPPMTYEQMLAHVSPQPTWERHHHAPTSVDRLLNVRPGGVERLRQFDPNFSVDLLAFTPGATAGTNAAKIESTLAGLQQQPQQQGSGGPGLTPLDAGMMAADVVATAGDVLPLVRESVPAPDAAQAAVQRTAAGRGMAADPWGEPTVPPRRSVASAQPLTAGSGDINLDAPGGGPVSYGPEINVSGGGPGTDSRKNDPLIEQQKQKRARASGKGLVQGADAALGTLDLGIGRMAQKGLQRTGAMARDAGWKNLGGALFRAGGAARVLAPVAAVGGAVLPAAMGALEGYEQAGAGGALIQGGAGAAGALAGGAIGTAILPGIGTVIGAGLGSMLGSGAGTGLTGLAQGAVEKAQMGDTGLMGGIGRALDPLIETDFEKEQKAVQQQLNSPAMQAVRQQERARQERVRADQMEALLMQSYLR